jgi:hypothetical protein
MPIPPTGIGAMAVPPAATTNGTPLLLPAGTTGVRFYLATGASLTYTVAHDQPSAPPTALFTLTAPAALTYDEPLTAGQQVFITGLTGTIVYRAL